MNRRRARRLRVLSRMTVPAAAVTFAQATPGMPGAAQTDGRTVYLQDGGLPDRRTLTHEIAGHNLDAQVLTDRDRARFSAIMGLAGKPWDDMQQTAAGQPYTGHSSASERFADMVAMIETKQFPKPGRGGGYAYLDDPPTLRELIRFGRRLERVRRRNNLGVYDHRAVRAQALRELGGK
jgi:hypothetical protein